MIVKILGKSATFSGVRYNTDKVEKETGELLKVKNFGLLQGLDYVRPQDYINYLEAVSSTNKRVQFPQFHAVISCKGHEKDKYELGILAEQWLKEMGYGDNPYLLIYHKDTANNHVHMVSTRVRPDGKKVNDSFEKLRAYEVLNRIMGINEKMEISKDIQHALTYRFSTRPQFMMLLELRGYTMKAGDADLKIFKFGKEVTTISYSGIDGRIASCEKNQDRASQLRQIIQKYMKISDRNLIPVFEDLPGRKGQKITAYSSALTEILKEKFGLETCFHYKGSSKPYGYTLIDNAGKNVFKGCEIIPLKELIINGHLGGKEELKISEVATIPITQNENQTMDVQPQDISTSTNQEGNSFAFVNMFRIDLSSDPDDEAVHGRKRERKQKNKSRSR